MNQPRIILPVLGCRRPVSLSAILEPVPHLGRRQPRHRCQFPLLGWIRVWVLEVPLPQQVPRAFLEAVGLLFSVPDGQRKWVLLPYPVLVDRTEGPPA